MDDRHPDPAEETTGSDEAPLGGDKTTEDQLDADNEVEQDMLKSLDPENPA